MSKSAALESPFVPFDPVPAGARTTEGSPRLKVIPKPENGSASEFSAFQPNATAPAHAHSPSVHGTASGRTEPLVTLQREGDRVTGIRIECTCGQVIELACSY